MIYQLEVRSGIPAWVEAENPEIGVQSVLQDVSRQCFQCSYTDDLFVAKCASGVDEKRAKNSHREKAYF